MPAIACGAPVVVSNSQFLEAPADDFTLRKAWIEGDCLNLTISSGGCSGASWQVQLIDAGSVQGAVQAKRQVRLSLKNEEKCYAMITKSYSFDIRPLRVRGKNSVTFEIRNEKITYNY